ncbi:hypothetical protein Q7P37_002060 [Cladosporium fusiforme]
MPKIVVVPHSAIVVRRPEKADLQPPTLRVPPLRTRFGKRGILFPSSSPTTSHAPEGRNLFRSSTLRRLLRRGSTSPTGNFAHKDYIFDLHANNQRQELHRRDTEEDLRRAVARTSLSRPFVSPPAPGPDALRKYGERQNAWKRRSMAFKATKAKPSNPNRWSLKTWKVNSGRERAPFEITSKAKPRHQSLAKRVLSCHSQRWSFRPAVPEKLEVKREPRKNVRVPSPGQKHRQAASENRVSRRYRHYVSQQPGPKKAASAKSTHPQVSYDDRLAVPLRQYVQSQRRFDQRHAKPALRAQGSIDSSAREPIRQPNQALDQRNIHPALRQQAYFDNDDPFIIDQGTTQALDQSHIHDALRQQTSSDNNNLTFSINREPHQLQSQSHIHPALRTTPSNLTNPPVKRQPEPQPRPPVPRVRIIPPSTFIQPQDFTTKHTILPLKPPTLQEQTTLLKSLNSIRASAHTNPLDLHPLLSNHAQDHAALYLAPLPPPKPPAPGPRSGRRPPKQRATTVEEITFRPHSSAAAIRLISPSGPRSAGVRRTVGVREVQAAQNRAARAGAFAASLYAFARV